MDLYEKIFKKKNGGSVFMSKITFNVVLFKYHKHGEIFYNVATVNLSEM